MHQRIESESAVSRPASALAHWLEKPAIAPLIEELLGGNLTFGIEAYDGSRAGARAANARIVVRTGRALHYILSAPGELGFARAYVAGDLDIEGDLYTIARATESLNQARPRATALLALVRAAGARALQRIKPPAEEVRLVGERHSRGRDAAAISHHYDLSNEFYRLMLGPTMTYSCAVFANENDTLEQAQERKLDLVCRKLGLRPGMRLLDVGCGWGSLVLHAAKHYGVEAVGITLSREQAAYADAMVYNSGLEDRIDIRLEDYREVGEGPYDAVSSIGMVEHVGRVQLDAYLGRLLALLRPGGLLLNDGISRGHRVAFAQPSPWRRMIHSRLRPAGFIDRYVFPDSELHEVGAVVAAIQRAGFEVCHVEGLRDHYALTLRRWVSNLERSWDEVIRHIGRGRARVWRLYMAACAVGFETNRTGVHQVLAVRPTGERTGLALRPNWAAR